MSDQGFSFLETVLEEPIIKEINKLSPYAIKLANRLAKEAPARARELEASGKLLATLKELAESEALNQWRSRIRMVRGEKAPGAEREASPPAS